MTFWGALAGAVVGTVVLTTGLRFAQAAGWTRMDIPLLLGTMFSDSRSRASAIGYAVHFVNGILFALAYYAIFRAVGHAGWALGAALGLVHAGFAGGTLELQPRRSLTAIGSRTASGTEGNPSAGDRGGGRSRALPGGRPRNRWQSQAGRRGPRGNPGFPRVQNPAANVPTIAPYAIWSSVVIAAVARP